jgi:hypothetical protein
MGTWGTGMLDNDVALDVMGTFDDQIAAGLTVTAAIAAVMNEYEDALDDPDDGDDVILALAWLASEKNALSRPLATRARTIVLRGTALARWEGKPEYGQRQAKEQALLAIMNGSAPHPGRPEHLQPEGEV